MRESGLSPRGVSLRARVTSWYVGLLAVTLIVFSCGIYFGMRTYLKLSLQQSLASMANSIDANFLSLLPEKGNSWVFGEIRESYPSDRAIRISSGGRTLFQSGTIDGQSALLDMVPLAPVRRPEGAFQRHTVQGHALMVYSEPFEVKRSGAYQVEVGGSLAIMTETLHSLALLFFIATPLILLAAALGGYLLMKRPLRPLFLLTKKAEEIGRNQLGERLPIIPTNDELERLTHALNRMIERLEEALAHNYRFSADASHELRTPLTIMRGEMEEMAQIQDLPPQAVENLVSSLDEIDRMSRIVHSLMAITRLDAGGERMDMQEVNLSALARATIEHMRLLAVEKNLAITLDAPEDVWLKADPFRIQQVLVNLIDNAIKYTPERKTAWAGGEPLLENADEIRVSIAASGTRAVLEVADHGIGVSAESLPHIFERFYRADYARNRVAGGVGLGLAIVKSIVAAHGGSAAMSSVEGQGSVVRIELPLLTLAAATSAAPAKAVGQHGAQAQMGRAALSREA